MLRMPATASGLWSPPCSFKRAAMSSSLIPSHSLSMPAFAIAMICTRHARPRVTWKARNWASPRASKGPKAAGPLSRSKSIIGLAEPSIWLRMVSINRGGIL